MRKKTSSSSRLGLAIAALSVVMVLTGAGFVREVLRARQIDAQIRALKDEAQRLQVRNFQVSSLEASMRNGEYLEREARLKLGLQKQGEQVVVLRKDAAPAQAASAVAADATPDWTNPKKWWMLFADPKSYEAYDSARHASSG